MKKIFLSIFILGSTVAYAQHPQHYTKEMRKHHAEKKEACKQALDLTKDQELAMNAIHERYKEKYAELKNNEAVPSEERREAFKNLHKEHRSEVKDVLTEEQVQKIEDKRAEFTKEHKGKKKHRKTNFNQLQKELSLTDQQVNDWKALNENAREKFRTIKGNESLSEDQKKAELKKIRTSKQTELKNILSEEQYKQYKESRAKKHHGHRKSRR